jgi:hypothetical protein
MSFAVWDVIWIVIGALYGIFAIGWGISVWRDRSWSLDLVLTPTGRGVDKASRVRFPD